jgi:hypothetical protein
MTQENDHQTVNACYEFSCRVNASQLEFYDAKLFSPNFGHLNEISGTENTYSYRSICIFVTDINSNYHLEVKIQGD